MWSIGIMLFFAISQNYPFTGKDTSTLFEQIKNKTLVFIEDIWDDVSPECIDLIRKLLDRNPKKRLEANEALKHDWFKKSFRNQRIS